MPTAPSAPPASPRRRGRLLHGESAIAVAIGVMNVATYGYTIVCARLLGPSSYGAFAAVMNLLLVVTVLSLGLQATAARRIASDEAHARSLQAAMLRVGWQAGFALGGLCLVLTPVIDAGLRLGSLPTAALVCLNALPLTVMGAQAGILQGERRWVPLALLYLAVGLPRLGLGTALVWWHPTETWALVGVTVAAWVPVAVGLVVLRDRDHAPSVEVRPLWAEALHNSQALLAFLALSNADIVLARHQLSSHQAGLYAGGLIMVKAVLYLPQFVVVLVFPDMSTPDQRHRALTRSIGLVAAAGGLAAVAAWVLPGLAMTFVGGDKYQAIDSRLWVFAILGTLLSLLQLVVYGGLARQARWSTALIWIGLVVLVTVGLTAGSWPQLLANVLATDAALFVVLWAVTAWRMRPATA